MAGKRPRTELMPGYVDGPLTNAHNPLSAITVKSMSDLGYVTDVTPADPYVLTTRTCPDGTHFNPGSLIGTSAVVQEKLNYPTHVIRHGQLIPIVRR